MVELYHDNFQNYKRYAIKKAQLVIADIPYNIGENAYGSCGVRPLIKLAQGTEVYLIDEGETTEHSIDTLTDLIKKWAKDRCLDTADPAKQLNKLVEEVGELAGAMIRHNEDDIVDAVGDIYVVLTILAMQLGLNIEECIATVYEEIKDRKGEMVNGIFVKQEDIEA